LVILPLNQTSVKIILFGHCIRFGVQYKPINLR